MLTPPYYSQSEGGRIPSTDVPKTDKYGGYAIQDILQLGMSRIEYGRSSTKRFTGLVNCH